MATGITAHERSAVVPGISAPLSGPQASSAVRVLHVYKSWTPDSFGGVEGMITTLAAAGSRRGITSRVLYLAPGLRIRKMRHHGIAGYRIPLDLEIASTGMSLSLLFAYRRLTRWADVLHFHFPWPYGDFVHLVSGVRTPYLVTYHMDVVRQRWLKGFYAPLRRWFLARAAAVVATSPPYQRTSPVLRRLAHKTKVVPLGIEDMARRPGAPVRTAYWRDRVGAGFILFVGVLRYYKGLDVLLEAAPAIRGRIVIAGSGPCEAQLKTRAKYLGLSNVIFLGEIEALDKDALFRLCSLFVFPSHRRTEAFGIALVEAAMYGKPMVSCELGTGTSFVNLHRHTGLVVDPGDPGSLGTAVNRLLADRDEREKLGRQARRRYLELFTAEAMVEAYAAEYRAILGQHAPCKP